MDVLIYIDGADVLGQNTYLSFRDQHHSPWSVLGDISQGRCYMYKRALPAGTYYIYPKSEGRTGVGAIVVEGKRVMGGSPLAPVDLGTVNDLSILRDVRTPERYFSLDYPFQQASYFYKFEIEDESDITIPVADEFNVNLYEDPLINYPGYDNLEDLMRDMNVNILSLMDSSLVQNGNDIEGDLVWPSLPPGTYYVEVRAWPEEIQSVETTILINVEKLLGGTITPTEQTASIYSVPATITSSEAASGGVGDYIYQWQSSIDNSTWTGLDGATALSCTPPAPRNIYATYYRRAVTSGSGDLLQTAYSNTVAVTGELCFEPVPGVVDTSNLDTRTQSLKTYEKVAVIDGEDYDNITFVERMFFYDYKGRVIQTAEINHLGGLSRYSTKYDFVGNVLASHESHHISGDAEPDTKLTEFTYDHRSRLLSETTTLNDGTPAIVKYAYDELGKLIGKTYIDAGPEPEVITMDQIPVGTNIRGWAFKVNTPLLPGVAYGGHFSMHINGEEFIILEDTSQGDCVTINFTTRITKENIFALYDAANSWMIPNGYIFHISDDRDYIVTSNDLPAGNDSRWEFDNMARINEFTETYDYNIQGWLTEQSNDLFEMKLRYHDPEKSDTTPSYTGNITEWEWTHKDPTAPGAATANTYAFIYDKP